MNVLLSADLSPAVLGRQICESPETGGTHARSTRLSGLVPCSLVVSWQPCTCGIHQIGLAPDSLVDASETRTLIRIVLPTLDRCQQC